MLPYANRDRCRFLIQFPIPIIFIDFPAARPPPGAPPPFLEETFAQPTYEAPPALCRKYVVHTSKGVREVPFPFLGRIASLTFFRERKNPNATDTNK